MSHRTFPLPVTARTPGLLARLVTIACVGLAVSGCELPADTAVSRCDSGSIGDYKLKWKCTISIEDFDHPVRNTIKVRNTSIRDGVLHGRFTVEQGRVRVSLRDSADPKLQAVASPGVPAVIEGHARLNRRNQSFTLDFEPEGRASGLTGEASFSRH